MIKHCLLCCFIYLGSSAYCRQVLTDAEADQLIQAQTPGVRYVDFHIHATTKNYFTHINDPALLGKSPYDIASISGLNWTGIRTIGYDTNFNNFKSFGQADYDLVSRSGASILCQSFTAIEKRLTAPRLIVPPLPITIRQINHWAVTGLSMKRLKTIYKKNNSSFDEFKGEYSFMVAQRETVAGNPSLIKPVKNKAELIANYKGGHTSLVISLEGGHILHGDYISVNKQYNAAIMDAAGQQEVLNNVDSIKDLPHRVFFITLGHFCWNGIVGFAKSLDLDDTQKRAWLRRLSTSEKFRARLFRKYSSGVMGQTYIKVKKPDPAKRCTCQRDQAESTTLGWDVINRLLAKSGRHQAPVYIDVKHMDIDARFEYYRYLIENKRKDIPIIASHVAVSGKDSIWAKYTGLCPVFDQYEEVEDLNAFVDKHKNRIQCPFTPVKERLDTMNWFYPWSINISNEEIPIIYASDGIIGLSLEERVLGKNRANYNDTNYISLLGSFLQSKGYSTEKIDTIFWMQPLLRNIFYVAMHSGRSDATAWNHISIGSDFDGIAKPVRYCPTVTFIPNLHSLLKEAIPLFREFAKLDISVLRGLSPEEIADRIIFKNGERFILKYF